METSPTSQSRHVCPHCGGTLIEVTSTRFVDWDCGGRSVPTRLMGPLIIIAGVVMLTTRLDLLGLVLVVAGGYFLLGHTETAHHYECPDCGQRQKPLTGNGDDAARQP